MKKTILSIQILTLFLTIGLIEASIYYNFKLVPIPILGILLIIGILGTLFMLYLANIMIKNSFDFNRTIQLLNNSPNVEEVNVGKIEKIAHKNTKEISVNNSSDIISKEEVRKAYEKIFSYAEKNITIDVSGPYKMDNGTLYYSVLVNQNGDEETLIIHIESDAKIKPEEIDAQGLEIKGALSIVYSRLIKNDTIK